jgi:hypothetical protein
VWEDYYAEVPWGSSLTTHFAFDGNNQVEYTPGGRETYVFWVKAMTRSGIRAMTRVNVYAEYHMKKLFEYPSCAEYSLCLNNGYLYPFKSYHVASSGNCYFTEESTVSPLTLDNEDTSGPLNLMASCSPLCQDGQDFDYYAYYYSSPIELDLDFDELPYTVDISSIVQTTGGMEVHYADLLSYQGPLPANLSTLLTVNVNKSISIGTSVT